ncbi:MAG: hypothetical protein ACOYL6_12410 [Bacteriovoracaceae bacterium]
MNNTKEVNFRNTVMAIEDLKSLVASDFKTIADLALFHVQEMKQNYDYDWGFNDASYAKVREVLEGQIKSLFDFYVKTNKQVTKLYFSQEKESFSLESWNRLLNNLDLVLRSMSFFKFHGPLSVSLKNNRLSVTGGIRSFKCEGEIRVKLYSLIRDFLKKETIFTYELSEEAGVDLLTLHFDFSHRTGKFFSFDTEYGSLSFSASLANYQVKNLLKLQGLRHQALIVDEFYQLSILDKIPENYFETFSSHEAKFSVFHFSFLFRPVSLIIPMRGENQISDKKNGSYVDIFSIINK